MRTPQVDVDVDVLDVDAPAQEERRVRDRRAPAVETTSPPSPAPLPLTPGSYGEIARRSGITRQQVSRILRGLTKQPGLETVTAIADAAGYSLPDLAAFLARAQSAVRRRRPRCPRK